MKLINLFLYVIIDTFFTSATPNLFGSKRRREEKDAIASGYQDIADKTQEAISQVQVKNPFETAAAKAAMAQSQRKAKQNQQRFANVIGGNTNPEALVAAQGKTQESVANTAGDIAVGSQAQKQATLGQLRGEKMQATDRASQLKQAASNERGSGWRDFYTVFFNPLAGGIKGAAGATAAS